MKRSILIKRLEKCWKQALKQLLWSEDTPPLVLSRLSSNFNLKLAHRLAAIKKHNDHPERQCYIRYVPWGGYEI